MNYIFFFFYVTSFFWLKVNWMRWSFWALIIVLLAQGAGPGQEGLSSAMGMMMACLLFWQFFRWSFIGTVRLYRRVKILRPVVLGVVVVAVGYMVYVLRPQPMSEAEIRAKTEEIRSRMSPTPRPPTALETSARLGWSLDQCVAEHGPNIVLRKVLAGGLGESYWFENRDLNVTVIIRNNKVQMIFYAKPSKEDFYQPEFDQLSAQNLPDGAVWEDSRPGTFANKNGARVVFRTYLKKEIIFISTDQVDMYSLAAAAGIDPGSEAK